MDHERRFSQRIHFRRRSALRRLLTCPAILASVRLGSRARIPTAQGATAKARIAVRCAKAARRHNRKFGIGSMKRPVRLIAVIQPSRRFHVSIYCPANRASNLADLRFVRGERRSKVEVPEARDFAGRYLPNGERVGKAAQNLSRGALVLHIRQRDANRRSLTTNFDDLDLARR